MIFVWTLQDVIGLACIALIALWALYWWITETISQARCEHDGGVNETMACDAICRKCGKNLGFIGARRKKDGEL